IRKREAAMDPTRHPPTRHSGLRTAPPPRRLTPPAIAKFHQLNHSQIRNRMQKRFWAPGRTELGLLLVAEPPQHRMPFGLLGLALDSLGRASIDYSEHAASIALLGHDEPERIGGGTEDRADLADGFDLVEHVYRERIAEHHDEYVACGDGGDGFDGGLLEALIGADVPDEAGAGSLRERHPKPDSGNGLDQGLVNVLDGLDEMGLAYDDVDVVGGADDFNRAEFHRHLPFLAEHCE